MLPSSFPRLLAPAVLILLAGPCVRSAAAQDACNPAFSNPAYWLAAPCAASSSRLAAETARRAGSLEERRADRWWAPDKGRHVAASFLLTLSGQYVLTRKAGFSEGDALPLSMTFSAAVGLSKELYDWRAGRAHDFSARDLAADGAGILLAAGLILL